MPTREDRPAPRVTVIIPTLNGGQPLARCLECLSKQTYRAFEAIVVDNSSPGVAAQFANAYIRVIATGENLGFGEAVNRGIRGSSSEFICTLNDDAYPEPQWLECLVAAAEREVFAATLASQIRLASHPDRLDSAGLGIYGDGTTKQRGHGEPAASYSDAAEVLLPSACAALYRRSALNAMGIFDPDYFLYCEDTDLGLRARLHGWKCLYVPGAVVLHDYSVSSGRASRLKAYYVERNRLYTVIKNFPLALWPLVPFYSMWRYGFHLKSIVAGRGLASEFTRHGEKWWRLVLIVGSAHKDALIRLPVLLAKRKQVRGRVSLSTRNFWKLIRRHYATASEIASQ